jgi:hypothetical protein
MRRIVLSLVVGLGVGAPSRPSLAATGAGAPATEAGAPPAETNPRAAELRAMHAEAEQRVERYNATSDASHLAAARELLARWLVEHRTIYGDTPAANSVRAPIEQQLGMIDAELVRVSAATTPSVVPAPAPAAAPAPRPAMTPEQATELRRARALMTTGGTAMALGGLTLVGASLPLWLLRERALRRADEETFYVDEQQLVSRARRRQAGAIATLAVGTTLAGVGVALLTVGAVKRLRLRRELAIVPELGPRFAGASASFRF